ncbi:DUF2145 domain-containing protein [Kaarinaea lacus]
MKTTIRMTLCIIILTFVMTAGASASSQAGGESQFEPEKIAQFAKQVEKQMAARGVRVFIIARVGRPTSELPDGIKYTHTAFGVYSSIKTSDGRTVPGYAIYNLYQRENEPNVSDLVVDYPMDFFYGVHELRAGIVIPKPELQRRLLAVINSNTYKSLHNPRYSVLANPYNLKYQNCTEHTLDVINAAIYDTDNRKQLKANEKKYFKAQELELNPLKLLMGAIFVPDVSVDDHEDVIQTSTFTTIANYLKANNLIEEQFVIAEN